MASLPELTTVIRAVNEATGPLRQVIAAIRGVGTEAEHTGHKLQHMESAGATSHLVAHIAGLRGRMDELHKSVGETAHGISELVPALAGLGSVGSAVGLVEMTEHVTEAYSELGKMATQIGVAVPQLQLLNGTAQLADVPVESMHKGLGKLNRAIADSAAGNNKHAALLFHKLGISLRDAHGHMLSAVEALPRLADAFAHTTTPALRTSMAMVLMGKGGAAMIPLLAKGGRALHDLMEEVKRVSFTPDPEQFKQMEEFHHSWLLLGMAVDGLKNAIGAGLAPIMTPIIQKMTDWITANRAWIAQGVAGAVRELADAFSHFDLSHPIGSLRESIGALIEANGNWGTLIATIGGFALLAASPFIASTIQVGVGIASLAKALIGPVIGAMATFVAEMWAGTGAISALGVAAAANPIGLIIIAAALAAAAAYELYEHWNWFKTKWTGICQSINDFAERMSERTRAALDPLINGLPHLLMEAWRGIGDFFRGLWGDVIATFQGALAHIQPIINAIGGVAGEIGAAAHYASGLNPFSGSAIPAGSSDAGDGGIPSVPPPVAVPSVARAAAGPAAAPPHGRVDVNVNVQAPPGTGVTTQSSGPAVGATRANLGHNSMLGYAQ